MSDRLVQIQKQLKRLREEYNATENKMNTTLNAADEQKCRHQLEDLRPKISTYEREDEQEQRRWQAFVEESLISEEQAKVIIAEIVEGVTEIELQQPNILTDEKLQPLRELKEAVAQPLSSPVAKVKIALSLFPPSLGVAYEQEIDGKKLLAEWFPTYIGMYRSLAKALAKK